MYACVCEGEMGCIFIKKGEQMEDICDLHERETDKSKTTLHSNKEQVTLIYHCKSVQF